MWGAYLIRYGIVNIEYRAFFGYLMVMNLMTCVWEGAGDFRLKFPQDAF